MEKAGNVAPKAVDARLGDDGEGRAAIGQLHHAEKSWCAQSLLLRFLGAESLRHGNVPTMSGIDVVHHLPENLAVCRRVGYAVSRDVQVYHFVYERVFPFFFRAVKLAAQREREVAHPVFHTQMPYRLIAQRALRPPGITNAKRRHGQPAVEHCLVEMRKA